MSDKQLISVETNSWRWLLVMSSSC